MNKKEVVKSLHKQAGRLVLKAPKVRQSKKIYNRKRMERV